MHKGRVMKRLKALVMATGLIAATAPATVASGAGQGDVLVYELRAAAADPAVAAKLAPGVKLFFGDEPAKVVSEVSPTETSRVGVRPARRTPISARCIRVAGNALITLSEEARAKGGNALVGIRSNYAGRPPVDAGKFECVLGLQMVTVSLAASIAVVE